MKIHFNSLEETRKILTTSDEYIAKMDTQNCVMITRNPLSNPADVQRHLGNCAENFEKNPKTKKLLEEHLSYIKQRWTELRLPEIEIALSLSNGQDAFGMPYTRFQTMFLPVNYPLQGSEDYGLYLNWASQGLLIHEFFHILSRAKPEVKRACYAALGFKPIKPLWKDGWVMNPDCPTVEHSLTVTKGREQIEVVPCIRLTSRGFTGSTGLNLKTGKYEDLQKTSYFSQVGQEYSYHPEEACAEWFVRYFYGEINSPVGQKFADALESVLKNK